LDDQSSQKRVSPRQRRVGFLSIAISSPVAVALWLGIDHRLAPIAGMDTLSARMLFTLKCCCAAALFCLVSGVEAVAHERLTSPAFDPLAGFATRRLSINLRYLQNTLEQFVLFAIGLFGLAAYCPDGASMRAVAATALVWVAARIAYWIGYHQSPALRGVGAASMVMGMLVLIYVTSRFGYELAGPAGAAAAIAAFLMVEAWLFWATRPLRR
jgi:uncharacterized MAPEG superfamily protein